MNREIIYSFEIRLSLEVSLSLYMCDVLQSIDLIVKNRKIVEYNQSGLKNLIYTSG